MENVSPTAPGGLAAPVSRAVLTGRVSVLRFSQVCGLILPIASWSWHVEQKTLGQSSTSVKAVHRSKKYGCLLGAQERSDRVSLAVVGNFPDPPIPRQLRDHGPVNLVFRSVNTQKATKPLQRVV